MAKAHGERLSLKDLLDELKQFESRYGMSSDEFYEKFNKGEMGDSADVIEWAGLYEWALRKEPKAAKR